MSAKTAQQQWEAENKVKVVDDDAFKPPTAAQIQVRDSRPWKSDPNYFKYCRISALALLKMVMHARKGGTIEVMGMLQGKVDAHTFIITDAFAVPVEATETRVNATAEAAEFMVQYKTLIEQTGKQDLIVGWYHSHPGYGCWLSGIDVNTQSTNQQWQDPFLAIVVDPVRTISSGKVEVGAFRTYPENYKPPDAPASEWQSIPSHKIEDFGVHLDRYYQLETTVFKNSMDDALLNVLWNKYWTHTLSASPLVSNRMYINDSVRDVADKLEKADGEMSTSRHLSMSGLVDKSGKDDSQLTKVTKDSTKATVEVLHGLFGQVLKDTLFNKGLKPSS